jgi:hypothetical protein
MMKYRDIIAVTAHRECRRYAKINVRKSLENSQMRQENQYLSLLVLRDSKGSVVQKFENLYAIERAIDKKYILKLEVHTFDEFRVCCNIIIKTVRPVLMKLVGHLMYLPTHCLLSNQIFTILRTSSCGVVQTIIHNIELWRCPNNYSQHRAVALSKLLTKVAKFYLKKESGRRLQFVSLEYEEGGRVSSHAKNAETSN